MSIIDARENPNWLPVPLPVAHSLPVQTELR